jgi:uncharacterized membrane protein
LKIHRSHHLWLGLSKKQIRTLIYKFIFNFFCDKYSSFLFKQFAILNIPLRFEGVEFIITVRLATWLTMKRRILIGSLSGPNFVKRTAKIGDELFSASCFFKTLYKREQIVFSGNLFPSCLVYNFNLVFTKATWKTKINS